MLRVLGDRQGNISLAMLTVLIGVLSVLAMTFLAAADTFFTLRDCDREQVFLFLRSESERCGVVWEKYKALHEGFYLPHKSVKMSDSQKTRTYQMQSRLIPTANANSGPGHNLRVFDILSLVSVNTPSGSPGQTSMQFEPVRGYSEMTINRSSGLLSYQYFTDTDKTTNDTNNYFWGPDVLYGRVHSNSDIFIKQGGGGSNNGWPTFHGPVFTAGQIHSYSVTPPYNQVFLGGYFENVQPITFNATADQIRAHGVAVGPSSYDPNRIMYVTVLGGSYISWVGYVYNAGPDTADVWTEYPPRQGTYLFRNRWTKYDTVWTPGPTGATNGRSNIVYSKLWLKGNFQGAQTWCAVDTLYLNDNITLAGTPMGQAPDGSVPGSSVNNYDYVGIVSEKSILVQYGYKDVQDSMRYKPNCDGDPYGGIWIYAALCALGDGNGNSHRDGVFSFEYQHPHPSVPATRLENTSYYVWDKIDLHRRKYPQSHTQPWPGNVDYPWYNPLWPEGFPYLERGSVHLWGSVAQRRSGYMHRDLSDPDYPNPAQIWNIPLDLCGGPAGNAYQDPVLNITFAPVNAPNATGGGIGYKRNFRYDTRLQHKSPPDFPEIHISTGGTQFKTMSYRFKKPPRNLTVLD
ncbi:MAG: hypothetical protein R6V77_07725 [Candidatus Cloacimonadaceae bacterium]